MLYEFEGNFRKIERLRLSASIADLPDRTAYYVEPVLHGSLSIFQNDIVRGIQKLADRSPSSAGVEFCDFCSIPVDDGFVTISIDGLAKVGHCSAPALSTLVCQEIHVLGYDLDWRFKRSTNAGVLASFPLASALGYDFDSIFDAIDPEQFRRACAAIPDPAISEPWPM